MSYDQWKTTNPADEFLGPSPDEVYICITCGAERLYDDPCAVAPYTKQGQDCRWRLVDEPVYCPRCALPTLAAFGAEWPHCDCPEG